MAFKMVAAAILLGVVALVTGAYALKLLFTEDLYVKRSSFGYYVTIRSSTIKDFPLLKVIGEEDYYSSCGDGPKLPGNGIRYTSSEDPEVLKQSIEQYLVSTGFSKQENSKEGGTYLQPDHKTSFDLMIMPRNDGLLRVVATEYYNVY
jgi:hypothetical protein